jgi:hypothetical protein
MPTPGCLITGDYEHPDFREVLGSLKDRSLSLPLERLWGLTEANQANLHVAIICQSRRDQFAYSTVEAIRDRLPLARIVVVQTDWCVGKKLPGQIWPGVHYMFVRDWPAFHALHLQDGFNGRSLLFDLSPTANDVDCQLYLAEQSNAGLRSKTIGIVAASFASYDALSVACGQLGAVTHWLNQKGEPPTQSNLNCIVYNQTSATGVDWTHLQTWKRIGGSVPLVLVMNFPRVSDRQAATASGAAAVIAQPFLLEQLQFTILRAIEQARRAAPRIPAISQ